MNSEMQNSTRPSLQEQEPAYGSQPMNCRFVVLLVMLALVAAPRALAQDDQDQHGHVWGDYTVNQFIEIGGHIADIQGSRQMYSTFVNVDSGFRLLQQELSMQSNRHEGLLFDNLYLSSYGFGGDPENVARLRISKMKWYNFVALYRRDRNFFDYNLFANPLNLNPGVTTCAVGCVNLVNPANLAWYTDSPHLQATTRNMGDFSLTLLPESSVSFRLGYARNNTNGTIDTTAGQPFVTILSEKSGWRSDRYQFGVDVKLLPRTTISGDVFFEHDKNDLGFHFNPQFVLGSATGLPVDIGLQFFPSTVNPACIISPGPPAVLRLNSSCTSAALNLTKTGNIRTDIPTGQLSLVSNYFRKLDIVVSGTYSRSDSDLNNFKEFYYGSSPTLLTGPSNSIRNSANSDFSVTYHLSKHWYISEKFRWLNWRDSGALVQTTFTCSHATGATLLSAFLNPCGQATNLFSLITGTNSAASLAGNATTGNFESISTYGTLVGERSYFNTAKLNWQPSRQFGAYIGYRYGNRELRTGTGLNAAGTASLNPPPDIFLTNTTTISNVCQLNPAAAGCSTSTLPVLSTAPEVDTEKLSQHTALFGVVLRPMDAWRINGDVEILSADNAFINIGPLRRQERMRAYTNLKVARWLKLNGGVHLVETRNNFAATDIVEGSTTGTLVFPVNLTVPPFGHKDHWRWYTAGFTMNPSSRIFFDLGWTLLDQNIHSATCMPLAANAFTGLTAPPACGTGATARPLMLVYSETTNSVHSNISFRATKRLSLDVGYEITADNGRSDWLRLDNGAPLQVVGDIFGNVPAQPGNAISPCPGASVAAGCVFAGPFPDQPLGPQAINWHKVSGGVRYDFAKGLQFKGVWNYYDYNSKDEVPSLVLLRVTAPRDFHANVGTVSIRYSF